MTNEPLMTILRYRILIYFYPEAHKVMSIFEINFVDVTIEI
jgi:hypothetical protein